MGHFLISTAGALIVGAGGLYDTTFLSSSPPPAATGGVNDAGADKTIDHGTDGDFFVDDVNGSDANDGLTTGTAKATVQAAIDALKTTSPTGGEIIRVRAVSGGGVYREAISLEGVNGATDNHIVIAAYGTERPRITGGEVVTGLTQCASGRSGLLGSGFANVYETTFNINATLSYTNNNGSATTSSVNGLGIIQGLNPWEQDSSGNWLPLSQGMVRATGGTHPTDNRFQTYVDSYTTADVFEEADGTQAEDGEAITKIDHSIISSLNATAIPHAFARIIGSPNISTNRAIASVSGSKITLASSPNQNKGLEKYYAISNYASDLNAGEWAVIDNGDGTATFFVRPHDVANLTANRIEWSTRSTVVRLAGTGSGLSNRLDWVELRGLDLNMAGGIDVYGSFVVGRNQSGGSTNVEGFKMQHCRVGLFDGSNSGSSGGDRNAMFWSGNMDFFDIKYNDFHDSDGAYGIAFGFVSSNNGRIQYNKFTDVGQTPIRGGTVNDCIWAYNDYLNCGRGAHSNQGDFKQNSERNWMHGNRTRNCVGYFTFQQANTLFYTYNDFGAAANQNVQPDSRAMEDQNGTPPTSGTTSYVWHNLFSPDPQDPTGDGALNLGKSGVDHSFDLRGNVIDSGGIFHSSRIANDLRNVYASLNVSQPVPNGTNNHVAASKAEIFTNIAGGDLSPVSGSAWFTQSADPQTDLITALKAVFPSAEVDALIAFDILGKAVTARVGPYSDPADYA